MGLVYIDFLPSGEVAGVLWWSGTKGYYYHVPERKLPFCAKKKRKKKEKK